MGARSLKAQNKLESSASYAVAVVRQEPASGKVGSPARGRPIVDLPEEEDNVAAERSIVKFGREVCGNFEAAEAREWLVTNGMGGYASGTIAGEKRGGSRGT